MKMTIGSLFAGIGGFDLGFERAGFHTLWQCEIDKAAQGVLRKWFPGAALHSDVREVGAHNLEPVDVITYGSPCQDLSVAGKRAGLAGGRSGLFHEAVRIIRELRERHGKPDFAIWENVPGAFSSNGGADFAAVVQAMVDIGAREVCWRVLDSRYFGVAQRRRRVFLVADFGGERAEQVLFEPESLRGDSKKSGKKRKEVARGAGAGAASRGGEWPADVSATLNTAFGTKMGLEDQHALNGASMFVPAQPMTHLPHTVGALCSRDFKGVGTQYVNEGKVITLPSPQPIAIVNMQGSKGNAVAQADGPSFTLNAMHGHDVHAVAVAAFDPLNITSKANRSKVEYGLPCHTLHQAPPAVVLGESAPAWAFAQNSRDEVRLMGGDGNIVGALAAQPGMKQTTYVAQAVAFQLNGDRDNPGVSVSEGAAFCLPANPMSDRAQAVAQPIAFHPTQDPISSKDGVTHAMSSGNRQGCGTPITAQPPMQVRRLTPTECERLQGFPDGWTAEGVNECGHAKPQSDGPRYKQLGNAVTVNVAEWIARRVAATLSPKEAPTLMLSLTLK